ncbi:MAG: ANTAR domain-containing protein [Pseudomonadota bacterium]
MKSGALQLVGYDELCEPVTAIIAAEFQQEQPTELSLDKIKAAFVSAGLASKLSVVRTFDALASCAAKTSPELLTVVAPEISPPVIAAIEAVQSVAPCAVILITRDTKRDPIRLVTELGVNVVLNDVPDGEKLSLMSFLAVARFRQLNNLRVELVATKTQLSERKTIERAKGILMQRKSLGEADAYRAMQKMAMDRNMRLVDLSETIISAAEILK